MKRHRTKSRWCRCYPAYYHLDSSDPDTTSNTGIALASGKNELHSSAFTCLGCRSHVFCRCYHDGWPRFVVRPLVRAGLTFGAVGHAVAGDMGCTRTGTNPKSACKRMWSFWCHVYWQTCGALVQYRCVGQSRMSMRPYNVPVYAYWGRHPSYLYSCSKSVFMPVGYGCIAVALQDAT